MMAAGVVLDTSFLITLADSTRAHHGIAVQYWKWFLEHGIPILLPTIVVSEFYRKQAIPPEILRSCVVLPFNWDDALKAAELDLSAFDRQGEPRDSLKDNIKILAQAVIKDSAFVISDDVKTFLAYAARMVQEGNAGFRPIAIDEEFDAAHFNGGQRELPLAPEAGDESDLT